MKRNYFVLKSVADFAPGAFENTAVEDGSIQLGRIGSSYTTSGCYTSPRFYAGAFLNMLPSWNADTPPGTAVEMQGRIAIEGKWSRWHSFGKWSPFIERGSSKHVSDEIAEIQTEYLKVAEGKAQADTAQIRIFLYTENEEISPKVYLLGASFEGVQKTQEEEIQGHGLLEVPQYSCLVRAPSLASRIMSSTSLCMLMNRWGEDALPEEIARAMYDSQSGRYGNISFVTGIAGSYGYECYTRRLGIELLREEIRNNYAVGVLIHYRAPSVSQEEQENKLLPELEDAVADSQGHLAVLRGFVKKDGKEFVILNDPLAPTNQAVKREMRIEKFEELYKNIALIFRRGPHGAGQHKPKRNIAEIVMKEQGKLFLTKKGKVLKPDILKKELGGYTICYTISNEIAYASAAQKRFYYPDFEEDGTFMFDYAAAQGHKIGVYIIGACGASWVGEKFIDEKDDELMKKMTNL